MTIRYTTIYHNFEYTVTVADNGGGIEFDYAICHYSNNIHYHFDYNADGAHTLTLKYLINGALEEHSNGVYPTLNASTANKIVSITATIVDNNVQYTVTRIDALFAIKAKSSAYNTGLNQIQTLTIPSSIKTIAERGLVMGMGNLTVVNWNATTCNTTATIFPSTVGKITVGSNVRRIPPLFTAGTGVTSLTVPASVTTIGKYAFAGSKLKTVVFNPAKVNINPLAFASYHGDQTINNTALTTLTWNCPEHTCGDGDNPLHYATALDKLTIGDAVKTVPSDLFNKLNISTLTIPSGVTTVEPGAFGECAKLTTVNWNAAACSTTAQIFSSAVKKINIGTNVKRIPPSFTVGTSFTSLTIPASVTTVWRYALSGSKLNTIVFNPTKVTINPTAFAHYSNGQAVDNTSLKNLTWNCPEYTCGDGDNPLRYTTEITKLTLGSALTVIPANLFNKLKITELTIPAGITAVEPGAFGECEYLTTVNWNADYCNHSSPIFSPSVSKINIGSAVRRLPPHFTTGTSVTSLTVPASVTTVGAYALAGQSLATVIFNPAKVAINPQAFAHKSGGQAVNNASLTSLTWNCPDYSYSGDKDPLSYVTELEKLTFGNAVTKIQADFAAGKTKLASVMMPSTIAEIGAGAFAGCSSWDECLTLPASLTTIGDRAFAERALRGPIVFPDKLTTIGAGAFKGCTGLSSFHLSGKIKNIGKDAFSGTMGYLFVAKGVTTQKGAGLKPSAIYAMATDAPACDGSTFAAGTDYATVPVVVPAGAQANYASAAYWKNFASITGGTGMTGIPTLSLPPTMQIGVNEAAGIAYTTSVQTDLIPAFYSTDPTIAVVDMRGKVTGKTQGETDVIVVLGLQRNVCRVTVGESSPVITGDLSGDGTVDLSDMNIVLNVMITSGDASANDLTGDGRVDVADLNLIINIMLGK